MGALAVVAPSVAPQGSAAVGLQLSRTAQRQGQISRPTFRRRGLGNLGRDVFDLGGPVDRSLRHRGQQLVVVGAVLGALIGVALGLAVEDAQPSTALAPPGRAREAALAARSSSGQPPASRAAGSGSRTHGNESSGEQSAESADRPGKGHGKADKESEGGRDKPGGRGKDKPGKDKGKDK
jgi:hypothetical protein